LAIHLMLSDLSVAKVYGSKAMKILSINLNMTFCDR